MSTLAVISQDVSTLFSKTGSLTGLVLTVSAWLVGQFNARIISISHHSPLFICYVLGVKLGPHVCIASGLLTILFPPPGSNFCVSFSSVSC